MTLSAIVQDLSEKERKLQLIGHCEKRFTLRSDGSVDEDSGHLTRVSQDQVNSLMDFKLSKDPPATDCDRDDEKSRYWREVRDYLKNAAWIQEAERPPIVASANTFVACESHDVSFDCFLKFS